MTEYLICIKDNTEMKTYTQTLSTVIWKCPQCGNEVKQYYDRDLWMDD